MNGDWYSDDEFWTLSFPFMFPDESFDKAREQVAKIVALSGVSGGALLDLGCGPGRHSVPFAEQGFSVTAVDRTRYLLERARTYAERRSVAITCIEGDMREHRRPEAYDLAISIFTSFGFFESAEDNQKVLDNVAASLGPGGALVMDLMGKEIIARKFTETDASEQEGAGIVIQRRRLLDDWSRIETDWILVRDGTARHFSLRVWLYSGAELKQMLQRAGFQKVKLYGNLDGDPYDSEARRLVAVAWKTP